MSAESKDTSSGHHETGSSRTAGSRAAQAWIWRVSLESAAVVMSILLALALDQWAEDQERLELADKSLAGFEREIQQNRALLEDISPFHRGIRDVLVKMDSSGEIRTVAQLRAVVGLEPLRPPFLTDAAWQTAVATGSLTYMDFETVSALSLTYTLQHRFQDQARSMLPDLIRASSPAGPDVADLIRYLVLYLNEVTEGEENLKAVYDQALMLLAAGPAEDRLPPDVSR